MPGDMLTNDAMVASFFFLELDGAVVSSLLTVAGIEVGVEVVPSKQTSAAGKMVIMKTRGTANTAPDVTVTRLAPLTKTGDKLWDWWEEVHTAGMDATKRSTYRKTGSIVVFDSTGTEISRYNFENAWPSKITTSDMGIDNNSPVTETIVLTTELLTRIK